MIIYKEQICEVLKVRGTNVEDITHFIQCNAEMSGIFQGGVEIEKSVNIGGLERLKW